LRFTVSALGRAALTMASILLIREFLAGVVNPNDGLAALLTGRLGAAAGLGLVAALLFMTSLTSSLLQYDHAIVEQRIVRAIELGVMERLISHLLSLSVSFFDRQSHGDILEAVRQDVTRLRTMLMSFASLWIDVAVALGLVVSAFWLSVELTLLSVPAIAVAAIPMIYVARRVRRRSYGARRRGYELFDCLLQMLRGIRIIKVYRGERAEARAAIQRTRAYFQELIALTRDQSLSAVALESLGGLSLVVVTTLGGWQVMQGTLAWPSLLAFLMAVRAMQGPLNNINTKYLEIERYASSQQRLEDLLAQQPEVRERPDAITLAGPVDSLALENLSFEYERNRPVIKDLSLELRKGDILGVVGPSGSGKTTLLSLIARFHDPSGGAVCLNGRDLRDYRLGELYSNIALVTQEPFLFSTTVRDNIRCGRPEASDEEVERAARMAEIHDELAGLAEGYETVVGTGGRVLSGGQIQRVNIARAILKNAPILLLDEATSNLDSIAEVKVRRAIARLIGGRTTIVVAHRLSTLRDASRILVLDRGRAVGLGSHLQLLASCSLYRQLWESQQLADGPDVALVRGSARGHK
jgi:ABC-type multidrug transport system fused ATPase/permease subunit